MHLVIVLIATLGAFTATYATQLAVKDQAKAFMENVPPVDLSKYTITLTSHARDEITNYVQYAFASNESTLEVICLF